VSVLFAFALPPPFAFALPPFAFALPPFAVALPLPFAFGLPVPAVGPFPRPLACWWGAEWTLPRALPVQA
jgi:hypothetical protein